MILVLFKETLKIIILGREIRRRLQNHLLINVVKSKACLILLCLKMIKRYSINVKLKFL